jgi:hypothetical protein
MYGILENDRLTQHNLEDTFRERQKYNIIRVDSKRTVRCLQAQMGY